MAKEITLSELANTAKSKTVTPASNLKPAQPKRSPEELKMTPGQVAKQLAGKNGRPEKVEDDSVTPPLVENAFSSMYNTIRERKERIENELMPIVRANAEEMALEQQMEDLGIENPNEENENNESTEESNDTSASSDDLDIDKFNIDEDDFLNDDEEEEVAEEVPTNMNDYITDKVNDDEQEEQEPINDSVDGDREDDTKEPEVESEPEDEPQREPEPVKSSKKDSATAKEPENKVVEESGDLDEFMKELDEEDAMKVVDDEEETAEEVRERFKEQLNEIKITKDPIDFNTFSIRRKPVSSSLILSAIQNSRVVKKADWVLFETKRSMRFTECSGPELDTLRKSIDNSNAINGVIDSLKFIYNHVDDANKPGFEAWCKLIRTEDIESMYFGIYKACYSDTNLIPRLCANDICKKTSLIDTKIDDMVKYADDDVKKKFESIKSSDTTTNEDSFKSTLLQISDDVVISYSAPTLYSTFIQFSTLKPEITQKYNEILNTMAYIDGFFSIDRKNRELVPIQIKEYPGNINKTILSKLKVYTEILKSLSNDQYNILTAKLNNLMQAPKITYVYPKVKCPECGKDINEEPIDSMLQLLFTRAQLVQIKSL